MTELELLIMLRELATSLPNELESMSCLSDLQLMDRYLTTALTAVRTRINQCTSMNKFPPEVLVAIFNFVHLPKWCEATDSEIPPDGRSLVSISHVCRRWRAVALDCSLLWTGIVSHSRSAQTFAQRSRDAPVDISVAVIGGRLSRTQKHLMARLRPRIRTLRVSIDATYQLPIFQRALRELSGSLEALAIVVRTGRWRNPNHHGPVPQHLIVTPSLSLSLFGGQATALRSLAIAGVYPPIPTDQLPSLMHLHLSGFKRGSHVLTHVAKLLRNTPALETFHLHLDCSPWADTGVLQQLHQSPITLPSTRRFCITSIPDTRYFTSTRTILSAIVLPPGALVTIQERSYCCQVCDNASLLFTPCDTSRASQPRSSLTVDEGGTTVFTRNADSTCHVIRHRNRITPRLIHTNHTPVGTAHMAAQQELHRNPFGAGESFLRSVHLLRIQGSATWSYPPWDGIALWRLVGHMPFLTKLVLRDFKREMLRNLTHLLEHDGEIILCPLLSSVVLSTLDLPRCHYRDEKPKGYTGTEEGLPPILGVLFRATARRAERGYPLQHLTFCSPHNEHEYTLRNAHGVEHVAVLRRDVWAEYNDVAVDRGVADHWAAVHRKSGLGNSASVSDGYTALWEGRLRRTELPSTNRHFQWHGHRHYRV